MKAYISVFRMRWKMETQYRGAVIGGVLCQIFFGLILVCLYKALYTGKPQSMPFSAVASYVWLQQAFFRMLLAWDTDLLEKIRTGAIAYELCRPLGLYGYYYSRIMAQKLVGSLMRAAPMLLFACLLPGGLGLSAPSSAAALICAAAALLLGLLCNCALEGISMALTMRTLDHRGIMAMMNLLMMTFAGNILPLTLFPDSWQKVITLLPYAQLLDAPIRLYTGQWPLERTPLVLLTQAAWSAVLVGLGILLWNRNQKRLIIQGG
ncbi:MAG: ABC-2 family transporter protein [Clostridia bacterium]|nr:ABC-2 family transporter protein [Clostridia bacterium]